MRSSFWAMAGLILLSATSVLQAQAPGSPPQQPGQTAPTQPAIQPGISPEHKKILDGVLSSWETDAKNLQSLFVQFLIEEKDPGLQEADVLLWRSQSAKDAKRTVWPQARNLRTR
ncbi:MAG: hypothetical protein QM703_12600 [Gemmatales bacterium]